MDRLDEKSRRLALHIAEVRDHLDGSWDWMIKEDFTRARAQLREADKILGNLSKEQSVTRGKLRLV